MSLCAALCSIGPDYTKRSNCDVCARLTWHSQRIRLCMLHCILPIPSLLTSSSLEHRCCATTSNLLSGLGSINWPIPMVAGSVGLAHVCLLKPPAYRLDSAAAPTKAGHEVQGLSRETCTRNSSCGHIQIKYTFSSLVFDRPVLLATPDMPPSAWTFQCKGVAMGILKLFLGIDMRFHISRHLANFKYRLGSWPDRSSRSRDAETRSCPWLP